MVVGSRRRGLSARRAAARDLGYSTFLGGEGPCCMSRGRCSHAGCSLVCLAVIHARVQQLARLRPRSCFSSPLPSSHDSTSLVAFSSRARVSLSLSLHPLPLHHFRAPERARGMLDSKGASNVILLHTARSVHPLLQPVKGAGDGARNEGGGGSSRGRRACRGTAR